MSRKSRDYTIYEDLILDKSFDILRIAIARFKGDPKMLSYIAEYEPIENGGALVILPLNTEEIETALGNNPSLDAFLEIEYATTDGRITTILQTSCKVKNDLIENAPNVELQEQFYDKALTDTLFLKKSDNLESLENKESARDNLEVYPKSKINELHNLTLQKSDNLASLENPDTARQNLNASSNTQYLADKRALSHNYGIYTRYGLSFNAYYGSAIEGYNNPVKFTILTTVLTSNGSLQVCSNSNSSGYNIYISNKNLNYGSYYDYSDENYTSISFDLTLSKSIEYGDKIAITLDNGILSVYKNTELIGQSQTDSRAYFYNPDSILSYDGIKKDFAYSANYALPATSVEGNASIYKYSIEDWVNGKSIPISLLFGLRGDTRGSFPVKYGSASNLIILAPKTQSGVYNTQLLYATSSTTSKTFTIFDYSSKAFIRYPGIFRLRAKVYLPSNNANLKKLLFRIGTTLVLKNGNDIEIISSAGIDSNGYMITLDSWVQVDVLFKYKKNSALGGLTIAVTNASNASNWAGANVETNDRFFIASASIYGQEGFSAYYEGGLQCSKWKDLTGNAYDISVGEIDTLSYPQDSVTSFSRIIAISSFSSSYYDYDYNTVPPSNYELAMIILRFDDAISDTSDMTDEWYQNRFILSYGSGNVNVNELLPAIPANTNYIIYPRRGRGQYPYGTLEINSMYSIYCGGTVTLIFQKVNI